MLLFLAAILSFPLALSAVEDPSRAADYDALRHLRSTYEDALSSNNLAEVKPLLAAGFTGVMISGEEIKSYEDFEAFWKRFRSRIGEGGTYQVKVMTDQTDFFGDVGLSRGYTEETIHTAAGKEYQIQARWTAVTRKENGEWKIFRVQGSVNPIDNPAIREMVKGTRLIFGVSGAAAGFVLGLLGCLSRRKRNGRQNAG
jgi:ketosteroid isomerase-like protein